MKSYFFNYVQSIVSIMSNRYFCLTNRKTVDITVFQSITLTELKKDNLLKAKL